MATLPIMMDVLLLVLSKLTSLASQAQQILLVVLVSTLALLISTQYLSLKSVDKIKYKYFSLYFPVIYLYLIQ